MKEGAKFKNVFQKRFVQRALHFQNIICDNVSQEIETNSIEVTDC